MSPGAPLPGADPGLKTYRLGTHRTVDPRATLGKVRPFLDQMGITRIANVTGLDTLGIPVVMVCRPNSRSISVSQGKGVELDAAKASGVMEAVETWHAERISLPLRHSSFKDLSRGHRVADVMRLPLSRHSLYHREFPLLWIEGEDLMGGGRKWLPYEMVHSDYSLPQPGGSGCFPANTNGLASGNHLLEAIAHGIYEVIERDALTLWRLGGSMAAAPAVDPESIDDDACRDLLGRLDGAGVDVRIWNATSDAGVPCFYCMILERGESDTEPEFGSGCHPAPAVALLRAVTEAAQARTTYIAGSRDDFAPEIYSTRARAARTRACRALMARPPRAQPFARVTGFDSDSLSGDIAWTLGRLEAAGIDEVIAVDLTRDDLRIPVVRVVIPGLEGVFKGEHSDYVPGPRARSLLRGAT